MVTGLLTLAAALSYGELAAMMPRAGGQYVYLREAYSPLWGFLYGWTLFLVIQTGTIAAVAVAFARYLRVLAPAVSASAWIVPPVNLSANYAVSLSCQQFAAILMVVLLTLINARGLQIAKLIQNVFTSAKILSLLALILIGLLIGHNAEAVRANFGDLWTPRGVSPIQPDLSFMPAVAATSGALGLFVAFCAAQVGTLFSSDAWNNITFTAGEVKNPRRNLPLSLALGTALVTVLYVLANVAYLCLLPLGENPARPGRPGRDRGHRGRLQRRRTPHHGGGDHDLDLRLQQRADPGRCAGLLRHGARRPVFPRRRQAQPPLRAGRRGWPCNASGPPCSSCRARACGTRLPARPSAMPPASNNTATSTAPSWITSSLPCSSFTC